MTDQPGAAPNAVEASELGKMLAAEVQRGLDAREAAAQVAMQKAIDTALSKQAAEFERKMSAFKLPGSAEATHRGQKYSFARAMAAVATGDFSVAPMEKEMHDQVKAKAMSFGSDAAGGFLVPNEVMVAELIPLLYAESVAMALGAMQMNGLTRAPIQIPRVSGGTTPYWVGEAATITTSDMALQQLQLTPHGLAALTVMSDLLQIMDNAGVEAMIRADMARQLGLKLDLGILKGTGALGQPIGIVNATGVSTSTLTDPATYNEIVAFVSVVRGDNALSGRLGWAVSNADMLELEQIQDLTGGTDNKANVQPLGTREFLSPDRTKLVGYPIKVSTQLADGDVIFGNWSDIVVAQWGGMRLDATNAVNFTSAQTHIRALTYVDVGIRHAKSFCIKT